MDRSSLARSVRFRANGRRSFGGGHTLRVIEPGTGGAGAPGTRLGMVERSRAPCRHGRWSRNRARDSRSLSALCGHAGYPTVRRRDECYPPSRNQRKAIGEQGMGRTGWHLFGKARQESQVAQGTVYFLPPVRAIRTTGPFPGQKVNCPPEPSRQDKGGAVERWPPRTRDQAAYLPPLALLSSCQLCARQQQIQQRICRKPGGTTMKMTTEEAFVKVLQRHGIAACVRHHRLGLHADLGSLPEGRHHLLGLRA